MPTKTLHGVTLWAVPRFHRSGMAPVNTQNGAEWDNKLNTYSFSFGREDKPKPSTAPNLPDMPETCH